MKTMNRCALLALTLAFSSGAAHARRSRLNQRALAPPAASRAAVPVVTRDNFVSLSMLTSGGIANLQTSVVVANNGISRSNPRGFRGFGGGAIGGGSFMFPRSRSGPARADAWWQKFQFGGASSGGGFPPPYIAPSVVPLSNNQINALLRILNEARFPALAGTYRQKNLADGINETLTLTISDEANRDRTFTIENYGDAAPRAYYQMMDRLRAFVALKFPEPAAATAPASSAPDQGLPVPITPPYSGGAQ